MSQAALRLRLLDRRGRCQPVSPSQWARPAGKWGRRSRRQPVSAKVRRNRARKPMNSWQTMSRSRLTLC